MRVSRHGCVIWRRRVGLLLAFGLAPGVAGGEPVEVQEPDFARPGFYVGVGATFGFPIDWNSVGSFESAMSEDANENAMANAEDIVPPVVEIEPVTVSTQSLDFEETRFGAGAIIGYRFSRWFAIELEGDAFADSSSKSFGIAGTDATGTAKSDGLWMVTGNMRVYPTAGRLQPFAIVGFGAMHAHLQARSTDLTTPARQSDGTVIELPAPFSVGTNSLDQISPAGRFGLGLDGYVNEHVVLEVKADYAIPFVDNELAAGDLLTVWVGLLYRF